MLDVAGLQLSRQDRDLLARPHAGGVILGLHGRNFESVPQLMALTDSIRAINPDLLIAVDQEGGRVQRFRQSFTRLPAMYRFGELFEREPDEALSLARDCGWLMASEVLSCGLDLSFAPVLDLYLAASRIIADRAFAADPAIVSRLASAFIEGMHDAGMPATGKHFPGHGSVVADSHEELPVDPRSLDSLLTTDLLPFVSCLPLLDGIMPGHVLYPAVDEHCAALSRVWLQDILRQRLGFDGVIFSDDLSMQAAVSAGDILRRTELALTAGCDMVLVCNARDEAMLVLDWLEQTGQPLSTRLGAMRGRALDRQQLLAGERWQHCVERISVLTGPGSNQGEASV